MEEEISRAVDYYGWRARLGLTLGAFLLLRLYGLDVEGTDFAAEVLAEVDGSSLLVAGAFAALERWRAGRALNGNGSWTGPVFPGMVSMMLWTGALSFLLVLFAPL